jgi:hypothetical protein
LPEELGEEKQTTASDDGGFDDYRVLPYLDGGKESLTIDPIKSLLNLKDSAEKVRMS